MVNLAFNPIRTGLFSHLPGQGEGGWLACSDAKNQGYHQPIKVKLCMSDFTIKDLMSARLSLNF